MILQEGKRGNYQVVLHIFFILIFIFLQMFIFCNSGNAREERFQMTHYASMGNSSLICLNDTVFYLENQKAIFRDNAVLYRISGKALQPIACFNALGYFAGCYKNKIVIQLVESTYKNFPTHIWYVLFDPISHSRESLPQTVENFAAQYEHPLIYGYDEILIINADSNLYSYTNQIQLIRESSFDFINFKPAFCFARKGRDSYVIYPSDYHVQVSIVFNESSPIIRIPGTDRFFFAGGSKDSVNIQDTDIFDNDNPFLETMHIEKADGFVVSIDSYGEYLYIITDDTIRRYNLVTNSYEKSDYNYRLGINDGSYLSDIIIYNNQIVYVIHENGKDQLVIDTIAFKR